MLTSDLVRVSKRAGRITPMWLKDKDRERLRIVADELVKTYTAMIGRTRAELDEAAGAVEFTARDRPVVAGLRKLCDDRTELEQDSPLDPEVVRATLFVISSAAHRTAEGFDREAALMQAAAALKTDPTEIEKALFADLKDAQTVRAFDPLTPDELLERYDLGLAQAVLLRATKVTVTFQDERPAMVRDLFRAARFHGLLHVIEATGKGSWRVTLDGPFSLFDSVQKYGLRLAVFLPSVLGLSSFTLTAELVWGAERERAVFELASKDRVAGWSRTERPTPYVRPEVDALKSAFKSLESSWKVKSNDRVLVGKDGVAIVPDLFFENETTGEEVFLEVFGFWSRAAVWRRVEQVQAGLPARLLLAVSAKARVSEEVLDEGDGGSSLYVFKSAISAKEILRRLDA